MAGLNTWVTQLDRDAGQKLRARLESSGFEFRDVDHALFGARGSGVNVVLYRSGKLVVQGKGLREFQDQHLLEVQGLPEPRLKARTIGADETGKGDYFGPLVVAACALAPEEERFLSVLVDSKTLGDAQALEIADEIAGVVPHEVIAIGPAKYNEMYQSFGNLNRLLAWAHARAITKVVEKTGCRKVVLDRFCDASVVRRALGDVADTLDLEIRPRAEDDPAVAAASILARAAFLRSLKALGMKIDFPLPKGAGSPVLRAGRALVQARGPAILAEVAKLHFKTTDQIS